VQIVTEKFKIFRTSLIGLSALLHKEVVIVYTRDVLKPSGIRRFGIGVSLLSQLWPVLRNGEPLIELLGNTLTFERVIQRPTLSHLWTIGRPGMRYRTCQQLPWRPARGHTCDVASPTKKPIARVAIDVKEAQATEKTIGSDMVVEDMM